MHFCPMLGISLIAVSFPSRTVTWVALQTYLLLPWLLIQLRFRELSLHYEHFPFPALSGKWGEAAGFGKTNFPDPGQSV